jgi:hypothetical protein
MSIKATTLRQNIYSILDQVIESGIPVEIERKGHLLKIIAEKPHKKLERLEKHDIIVGNPDDIIHIDWSQYWGEEKKL